MWPLPENISLSISSHLKLRAFANINSESLCVLRTSNRRIKLIICEFYSAKVEIPKHQENPIGWCQVSAFAFWVSQPGLSSTCRLKALVSYFGHSNYLHICHIGHSQSWTKNISNTLNPNNWVFPLFLKTNIFTLSIRYEIFFKSCFLLFLERKKWPMFHRLPLATDFYADQNHLNP